MSTVDDVTVLHHQIRPRPLRAVACWKGIVKPVARQRDLVELVMAVSGPGLQIVFDRFREWPEGQKLLADRPDLAVALADDDRLRSCPDGSLGHALVEFQQSDRVDAEFMARAGRDLPAIADRLGWDDGFHYVIQRGFAMHDLVHVLCGYGTDTAGELAALGFTHGQCDGWVTSAMLARFLTTARGGTRRERGRYWREAVERGRDAPLLLMARFEDRLEEPLEDLRVDLGIPADSRAHPDGHLSERAFA